VKYQVWKPSIKENRWVVINKNGALYDVTMSREQSDKYTVLGHGVSEKTYDCLVEVTKKFEETWETYYPHAKPSTLEIILD
jgi:hypothetical protein